MKEAIGNQQFSNRLLDGFRSQLPRKSRLMHELP